MTDNEIIKALECCKTEGGCHECPLKNTDGACYKNMLLEREALDLINRQKAEIEKLKAENENQNSFEQKMWATLILQSAVIKSARTEAIKEFAERLKGLLALNVQVSNEGYYYITTDIDNLVKEMAGEG